MGFNTMSNVVQEQMLREITLRIVREFQPHRIVLFGSRARGDAQPDSDVDLLVVMPVDGSVRAQAAAIDLALADRAFPLDLVVMTPEQFHRLRHSGATPAADAFQSGKVLYDHAA